MRGLNLACGEHANITRVCHPVWVSVDRYNMAHWAAPPDVIADALGTLPFADDSFDAVYLGHFLEHLEPGDEMAAMFREVRRVCKTGAGLAVVGPCWDLALESEQPDWLLEIIKPDEVLDQPKGIQHRWLSTGKQTLQYVWELADPEAELIDQKHLMPPIWPNPSFAVWQFGIIGTLR